MSDLIITPITQREAKEYIRKHHRHHPPPVGSVFQLSVTQKGKIVGVAMVGRPVARVLDDKTTLEVNRLCTQGVKNACSKLYGASARVAKELGYKKIITYILDSEKGTSLKAAGWTVASRIKGRSWSNKSRPRVDKHPIEAKVRYEKSW